MHWLSSLLLDLGLGFSKSGKASGLQNVHHHIDFPREIQVRAKSVIVKLTISYNCHSRCCFDNNYNVLNICARICIYSSNSTDV